MKRKNACQIKRAERWIGAFENLSFFHFEYIHLRVDHLVHPETILKQTYKSLTHFEKHQMKHRRGLFFSPIGNTVLGNAG